MPKWYVLSRLSQIMPRSPVAISSLPRMFQDVILSTPYRFRRGRLGYSDTRELAAYSVSGNKANTPLSRHQTRPDSGRRKPDRTFIPDDCLTATLVSVVSLPLQSSRRIFFVEPALCQDRQLGVSSQPGHPFAREQAWLNPTSRRSYSRS